MFRCWSRWNKNTLKLSWADETTEPKGRCVGTTWLDDEALKNQNTEPDLRELLFPDLMTSSPCPRFTAHETLTDLFPQLLVLFDSDMFFSSGLLHCIMGTVVSHQVSTTVALSSIKLSVTTVTDTQVSEGEKSNITFASAVMSEWSAWKFVASASVSV